MADSGPGADHAAHDRELIARVASGDGSSDEIARASRQRVACLECTELDADLRDIVLAVRRLAIDDVGVVAPRDFRLSVAGAANARPGRVTGLIVSLRSGLRRSLGVTGGGLVALGIVGMLFGTGILPRAAGGDVTGAAPLTENLDAKGPVPGQVLAPASSADMSAPTRGALADRPPAPSSPGPAAPPNPVLVGLSGAVLATGLALLLAVRRGRRSGP